LSIALCASPAAARAATSVDHSLWGELLREHVKNGVVDYAGFQGEEHKLDRYLETLSGTDPDQLSRDGQFAFYTNAYNAWTIKLILTAYPDIASIKDLGGFLKTPWEKEFVALGGETVTLDHIEHDILRPRFKDPRVHFAINCAAVSCPPLQSEPFRPETLEQQLNAATRSFLNDPQNYRLEGNEFHISRIFKWFGEDFDNDPLEFYLQFAEEPLKSKLEKRKDDIDIEYLDYDWGLNGK
jgi:hypothetical protein